MEWLPIGVLTSAAPDQDGESDDEPHDANRVERGDLAFLLDRQPHDENIVELSGAFQRTTVRPGVEVPECRESSDDVDSVEGIERESARSSVVRQVSELSGPNEVAFRIDADGSRKKIAPWPGFGAAKARHDGQRRHGFAGGGRR